MSNRQLLHFAGYFKIINYKAPRYLCSKIAYGTDINTLHYKYIKDRCGTSSTILFSYQDLKFITPCLYL